MVSRVVRALVLVAAVGLLLVATTSTWGVDSSLADMPIQGHVDSSGAALPDANRTVRFRLFQDSLGGAALWSEQHTLAFKKGNFAAQVGSISPGLDSVMRSVTNGRVFLETEVNGQTLSPRTRMGSVPFAMTARGITINNSLGTPLMKTTVDTHGPSMNMTSLDGNTVISLGPPDVVFKNAFSIAQGGTTLMKAGLDSNGPSMSMTGLDGNTVISLGPPGVVFKNAFSIAQGGTTLMKAGLDSHGPSMSMTSLDGNTVISLGPPNTVFKNAFSIAQGGIEVMKAGVGAAGPEISLHSLPAPVGAKQAGSVSGFHAGASGLQFVDSGAVSVDTTVALAAQGITLKNGAAMGYVLTSDDRGLGTWQPAPAGGTVDWHVTGNAGTTPGTNFLGTTDNQALEIKVNGLRAMRIEPNATSPNVIGGYSGNNATATVKGATIAGGGRIGNVNSVTDPYGTVGGGIGNRAGDGGLVGDTSFATVGGGSYNIASGLAATISGGAGNTASANNTVVGGGYYNTASGSSSVVSGGRDNTASGLLATIGGGIGSKARGDYSVVSGGGGPLAADTNCSAGLQSTVSGGAVNAARGAYSTVGGGIRNQAFGLAATVGGGLFCRASGDYAVVAGGGGPNAPDSNYASGVQSTVSGGIGNAASGSFATVGGGVRCWATAPSATISGGWQNTASGQNSFVGSGGNNVADGWSGMIPGGEENRAGGNYSFAAGHRAKADHAGTFVWGDTTNADVASSAINQFTARASGGVRFFSNAALTAGVTLAAGGGSWASVSDRDVKANVEPVNGSEVLARLAAIPIAKWNYTSQDEAIRHIGPMAQDFYAAFGVGEDDRHITSIDADGVALAAIQELYRKTQQLEGQAAELEQLRALVNALQAKLEALTQKQEEAK